MAGVLVSSGQLEGFEATGIFKGTLIENMIDTVRRVKKPFIDVLIPDLFFDDTDYPLTFVPDFNMVLPLKKDQEVWVYFNQDNHRYPVLWKLSEDFDPDSGYLKDYTLPGGGDIASPPSAEETLEVLKISDDVWLIATKSYGVLHRGDQCVLLGDSDVFVNASGKINLHADSVNIQASSGIVLKSGGVEVSLEGTAGNLKFKTTTAESEGTVKAPKSGGGFLNSLPVDPLSGAPHQG